MNAIWLRNGKWEHIKDKFHELYKYTAKATTKSEIILRVHITEIGYTICLEENVIPENVLFRCDCNTSIVPMQTILDIVLDKYGIPKPEIK